MASTTDIPFGFGAGAASIQLVTRSLAGGVTANAGELTGSAICIMTNTGASPAAYTTRTGPQMQADSNLYVGQSWFLILANNQATGTLTFTAGANVVITGTPGVAANVARLFTASLSLVAGVYTVTFVGLALSWTSAI